MAKVQHYNTPLEEGHFYHVYNRAVGGQTLFKTEENYRYFLRQYALYITPIAQTYAYCLLGNHFHFLIRVRETALNAPVDTTLSNLGSLTKLHTPSPTTPSGQFKRLFQSYALAFNKQQGRTGTLFETPFKRAHVDSQRYLTQLIYYIHANPQHHGLIADFRDWPWSSYQTMVSNRSSRIEREEVLALFDDRNNFEAAHNHYREVHLDNGLLLD